EFDAHDIDFDVLQNRNTRFWDEEKALHHKYHGSCIKKAAKRMKAQETRKTQKAAKTKVIKKDAKKKKPTAKTRKTR
ncbi:MAG: hypothetical protein KAS15_05430, partial [Nanoarchaeota archaeon]|nr:hypothetical protein [Nanoarchaeota archaeon]